MFVIEDLVLLLLLAALGFWGFISTSTIVRVLVASAFLFVIVFAVMSFEPAARSVITHHKPWTQEFKDGVSQMLKQVMAYRPYVLVAGAGLFLLAIKSRRFKEGRTERPEDVVK